LILPHTGLTIVTIGLRNISSNSQQKSSAVSTAVNNDVLIIVKFVKFSRKVCLSINFPDGVAGRPKHETYRNKE